MRQALGEVLDRASTAPAPHKVSTASLRALQHYSRAAALTRLDGPSPEGPAAEQLLLEAVREDPAFASAHVLLAYVTHHQGRPLRDVLTHAERAVLVALEESGADGLLERCSYREIASALGKRTEDAARMAGGRALLRLAQEMD